MKQPPIPPRQYIFDATPEIFATDTAGSFAFPLSVDGSALLETEAHDEIRFIFSIWHPSEKRTIDLDRAYLEVRASVDPQEERWTRLAEVEPVVPPFSSGDSFDGWLVLPVMASSTAYLLHGTGFEARCRTQIRASAYLVS